MRGISELRLSFSQSVISFARFSASMLSSFIDVSLWPTYASHRPRSFSKAYAIFKVQPDAKNIFRPRLQLFASWNPSKFSSSSSPSRLFLSECPSEVWMLLSVALEVKYVLQVHINWFASDISFQQTTKNDVRTQIESPYSRGRHRRALSRILAC